MKLVISPVLSVVLLMVQTSAVIAATPGELARQTYESASARLAEYNELLREVRGELDANSLFDPDEIVLNQDFAAEEIVPWVKNQIAFQQYSGLLRGIRGTLVARSGNSLDQSVLLAKLLKDAGYDARVARSQISQPSAKLLLSQLAEASNHARPIPDLDRIESRLYAYADSRSIPRREIDQFLKNDGSEPDQLRFKGEVVGQMTRQAALARARAQGRSVEQGLVRHFGEQSTLSKALIEEARDYFFVEYRLGPGDEWLSAHAALSGEMEFTEPVDVTEYFAESIPEELQHRFSLALHATQKVGSRTVERRLGSPWSRPSANLVDTPLSLTLVSANLMVLADSGKEEIEETDNDLFVPYVNGVALSESIDLQGNVIPTAEGSTAAGALFREISSKGNQAVSALSGIGTAEGESSVGGARLESVRVEYVISSPNGLSRSHSRLLFDRSEYPDPASVRYVDILKDLSTVHTISMSSGSYDSTFVFDSLLESWIGLAPGIQMTFALRLGMQDEFNRLVQTNDDFAPGWGLHKLQQALFDSYFDDVSTHYGYLAGPAVSVHSRSLPLKGTVEEAFDIVQLPYRAIDRERLAHDPRVAAEAGAWASLVEGTLLSIQSADSMESAAHILRDAEESGADLVYLKNSRDLRDLGLNALPSVLRSMEAQLDSGYLLAVPFGPDAQKRQVSAWWSVEPATGETVARLGNGSGGVIFTEELALTAFGKMVAVAAAGIFIAVVVWSLCSMLVGFVWVATSFATDAQQGIEECKQLGKLTASSIVGIYALMTSGATALFATLMAIWGWMDFVDD